MQSDREARSGAQTAEPHRYTTVPFQGPEHASVGALVRTKTDSWDWNCAIAAHLFGLAPYCILRAQHFADLGAIEHRYNAPTGEHYRVPMYDFHMSDAWDAVRELRMTYGWHFSLESNQGPDQLWRAAFTRPGGEGRATYGATAPEAIARAVVYIIELQQRQAAAVQR